MSLLVTDNYDQEGTPADFAKSGLPGSDPEGMLFPAYLRFLVRYNESRRSLLQLYMVLETESFSEGHPLHDYFENRPKYVWEHYSQYTWKLPPERMVTSSCSSKKSKGLSVTELSSISMTFCV